MKKLYKVVTERNSVKWINAYSKTQARYKMYQLLGSELFTIKKVQKNEQRKINRALQKVRAN